LRKAGLEITQFGLLTALATTGEANQKRLSAGFAMDSTTLTRTLGLMRRQGWVRVRPGKDRRERLFRLTQAASEKWQKLNLIGAGQNSDCGENLAMRGGKHEADDLANYRGRDGGVNSCNEYRCIYIYVIRGD